MEFVEIVNQYGVPISISAVVIYGLVKAINYFDDYHRKKLKLESVEKHNDQLDKREEVSEEIYYLLDEVMVKTGASRVGVTEYHNGGNNMTGMYFKKMTATYEKCADGVFSVAGMIKDINTSLYGIFIPTINKNQYVLLDTQNRNPLIEDQIYRVLKQQDVHYTLSVRILSDKCRPIGMVSLDYNNGNNEYSAEDIVVLQDLAFELGKKLSI